MEKILIAVDLEGVNKVVGYPYKGLIDGEEYEIAKNEAVNEINIVVKELFKQGVKTVAVWDNHAGGDNLDFKKIDKRVIEFSHYTDNVHRAEFCKPYNFDGVILLGYHTMEGTIGGVLAHTFNSSTIQYIKIGKKCVGEAEIDSNYFSDMGVAPIMYIGDDLFIKEVKKFVKKAVFVETKKALGRNKAEFSDEKALKRKLKSGVKKSLNTKPETKLFTFPETVEIRFTHTDSATEVKTALKDKFGLLASYKNDAHTLTLTVNGYSELKEFLGQI